MAKKVLAAQLITDNGDTIYVYKSGRTYWLNYGFETKVCHPSVRTLADTKREAVIVFHVKIIDMIYV